MMKEEIEIPGTGKINVKRGKNIRLLSLRVAPGKGAWINVPSSATRGQVEKFILANREWLLSALAKIKRIDMETGERLGMYSETRTKFHLLKVLPGDNARASYRMEGEEILFYIPRDTPGESVSAITAAFLAKLYRVESKRYLPGRVEALASRFHFRYGRVSFRDNVSNWGSCSSVNNISLNIWLMKLPDELIDYVILHELCHTVEKNHSASFWALMKKVCPGHEHLRARLRTFNTRS